MAIRILSCLGIVSTLLLAACGGGGDDGEVDGVCTPVVARVDVFGDSVNYAAAPHIQAELDRRFGVGAAVVRNRAVPGSTSQMLVTGTDGLNAPWPQSVSADIVLVNHGINDSYAPLGITAAQYRTNVTAFAAAGAVLQTPSPTTADVYDTTANAAIVREVATAAQATVADVQAYVLSLPNWAGHMPDGIHPNDTLHALIAREVTVQAIAPMVATLRCHEPPATTIPPAGCNVEPRPAACL